MSLPTSPGPGSRRVTVQQSGIDVYTVLLIISAIALLIGIILFALELNAYGWTVNPTGLLPGGLTPSTPWTAPPLA